MDNFLTYISEFNFVSIVLRLSLAVLLGGTIGLERRLRKRSAGLRTFALVCVGAALAMVTNEYLFLQYEMTGDPGRMAAQVISGVGFLGAGTIILNGKRVKGLTTAASLWATAAIGIAVGSGFFVGAIFGFFVISIATTFMQKFEKFADKNNKFIELYVELSKHSGMSQLIGYITENDFALYSVEKTDKKKNKEDVCIYVEINLKKRVDHGEIVAQINLLDNIIYAEEVK